MKIMTFVYETQHPDLVDNVPETKSSVLEMICKSAVSYISSALCKLSSHSVTMVCHVTVVRDSRTSLATRFLCWVTIFGHLNIHKDNDFRLRIKASIHGRHCANNKNIPLVMLALLWVLKQQKCRVTYLKYII